MMRPWSFEIKKVNKQRCVLVRLVCGLNFGRGEYVVCLSGNGRIERVKELGRMCCMKCEVCRKCEVCVLIYRKARSV